MELHGTILNYIELATWNYMELHGTTWNYMELHGTIWDYMKLYETTYGTIWN